MEQYWLAVRDGGDLRGAKITITRETDCGTTENNYFVSDCLTAENGVHTYAVKPYPACGCSQCDKPCDLKMFGSNTCHYSEQIISECIHLI